MSATGGERRVPEGSVPEGSVPDGRIPAGPVLDGPVPDGSVPDARAAYAAYLDELAGTHPDLLALAESLCLAAGVERTFLRRARLRFLPRTTAGLEAELWFSPLVEATGEHTLLLAPRAAEALRERLAHGPRERADAVHAFTEETHREAAPLVRWFEGLLWAGLFPGPGTDRLLTRELRRVLTAVTADGADADDLGRWALHYLPRLPDAVLRHDDAWRIRVVSSERLGLDLPPDASLWHGRTTARARALGRRELPIGVEARSGGVVLSRPPAAGTRPLRAPGLRTVRLAAVSALTPPPVAAAPVRLELTDDRSLSLPFTVLQRLDPGGTPVLSLAHSGGAEEIAVAAGDVVDGQGVQYAFLARDGAIVRHTADGRLLGVLPAPASGALRRSLGVSPDGGRLVWIEADEIHEHTEAEGRTSTLPLPEGARPHRVCFPDSGADAETAYGTEQGMTLRRRGRMDLVLPGVVAPRELSRLPGGRGRAVVVGRSGDLTLRWNRDARGRFLTLGVTALADHAERRIGSAALADGTVLAWAGSPDDRVPLGQAPWQITALAVSADGRRLAAVGGDSRMLVWGLGRSAPYEEVPLAFCADHVFAHPDGGWVVSGTGGPVELTTEDGRRHRITPVPDDTPEDGPPAWLRDAVLAEADRSGIASLLAEPSALARLAATGVGALVVGPYTPPPPGRTGPMDEIAALRAETRRHGLRIVVDLHPPRGPQDDVLLLDCVRRWLDQDIDGVRISAGPEIGARHLDDLRHLLDGYEDRVLIRSGPPTAAGFRSEQGDLGAESDACDLLQPGSLTIAFVQGFGNGNLYTHAHRLRLALEVLRSSGLRAGWAHTLPDAIRPAQRRSAAAVLLGLPGVPLLPPDLLGDPAIATLLELRRAHPALSRGAFDVRPYTGLGLLAVVRTHGGETVLCLTNSGAEPATVDLTPGYLGVPGPLSLLDLLDGGTADCAGTAPARTVVDGGGVRWFLLLPAPGRAYPGTGPVAR